MFRTFGIILFLLGPLKNGFCQFADNFSDGDFSSNPEWLGATSKFTVSSNLLRLNDIAAGTTYLSTSSTAIHEASWEFFVQLDFNTSGTNYARVYLVSDQVNLTGTLNGYFVSIGGTTLDDISLNRQTGNTITKLIDGTDNAINFTTVKAKIKVTRDDTGNWSLYLDISSVGPTGTYSLEGTANDITHTTSNYFGVYCLYTVTRATAFWFDDFVVTGSIVPDLIPPTISNVQVINPSTVKVQFNEKLDGNSAQLASNYNINNSIGNPLAASLQADGQSVILTLSNSLTNGAMYELDVNSVEDLSQNKTSHIKYSFLYFVEQPTAFKDIIISEFMADPTPIVGLPETEYVEIYNRSTNPVNLLGWKLSDGSATATLSQSILQSKSRLVISTNSGAAQFTGAMGVSNFPSFNNTGDNIILKNSNGIMIDSITYSDTWYHSGEKKDGGWSIEIIDPENLCEEEGNWTSSENSSGGTPGLVNSVNANNPDLTPPKIIGVNFISSTSFEVLFNEKMDKKSQPSISFNATIYPIAIKYDITLRKLLVETDKPLEKSFSYQVEFSNVFDCSGNELNSNVYELIFPEEALEGEVLINEILFNPKSGGVDFVEIYNRTQKHLSLKGWQLANIEEGNPTGNKLLEIQDPVIHPNSFLVFTSDPAILKAHYPRVVDQNSRSNSLPSMPDDEGSIALVNNSGLVIDYFIYSDNHHSPFLKDDEGVSLERISPDVNTNLSDNWKSAVRSENFATPGYKNSSSSEISNPIDGQITVEPEIFSPQAVSNDFTKIVYRFSQSGWVANASVYDHQGRLIKGLANNEVIGAEGFFRWDGDRDDGSKARAGYYVVIVEVFNTSGNTNTFRNRVVIAYR